MPATLQAVDLARLRAWTASGRARTIREEARLSRSELARSLGLHESTIAHWECGRRQPTGAAAERYFHLLNQLRAEML